MQIVKAKDFVTVVLAAEYIGWIVIRSPMKMKRDVCMYVRMHLIMCAFNHVRMDGWMHKERKRNVCVRSSILSGWIQY